MGRREADSDTWTKIGRDRKCHPSMPLLQRSVWFVEHRDVVGIHLIPVLLVNRIISRDISGWRIIWECLSNILYGNLYGLFELYFCSHNHSFCYTIYVIMLKYSKLVEIISIV